MKKIICMVTAVASMLVLSGCGESDEVTIARIQANERIEVAEIQAEALEDGGYQQGYAQQPQVVYQDGGSDFVEGAVVGAVVGAGAMMLFSPTSRVVDGRTMYYDKKGKTISQSEYNRRLDQSRKAKARNAAKRKAQANANTSKTSQVSKTPQVSKNKPTVNLTKTKPKVNLSKPATKPDIRKPVNKPKQIVRKQNKPRKAIKRSSSTKSRRRK